MTPLTHPMSTPSLTSHPPEDDQSGTSDGREKCYPPGRSRSTRYNRHAAHLCRRSSCRCLQKQSRWDWRLWWVG